MRRFVFIIVLSICITACEAHNCINYYLGDKEFFEKLNLDYPGLEAVKESVEKNDFYKAKKDFVAYLKKRTIPKWYFDWRDFSPTKGFAIPSYIKEYADRHVNNEMLAHGTWHKYGKTIDWTVDYSYDHYDEWVWQLNIHYCWVNLADAYWSTGDEKYAKAFVRQLNGWIDQCSSLNGYWNGVGSVWRPLDAGQRMQRTWPVLFYRFLASPSFDDESIFKMVKSFYQHAVHLNSHPTTNNWLTLEMSGLYIVGGLFPEFKEAAGWCSFAANRLNEEELKLFYPDGAEIELAPGYHAVSVSSMATVHRFAQLNGYQLPKGFIERMKSAYDYFVKLRMPDGTLPALNDSEWLNSKQYLQEASDLFPDNATFKFFVTDGNEGKKPDYSSVWMPWAGWYVMRSDWSKDAFYALFEVGPYGSAHQHEDKLSFILYAYGARLITESGYYPYDQSDWRKYAQSASGHNVVRVDGKDQNRSAKGDNNSFNLIKEPLKNKWITVQEYDFGEGSYTEGFGPDLDQSITHHRTLKFIKNKLWMVTDTFTPSDSDRHTYETWFHFNTPFYGITINDNQSIVYSNAKGTANVAIVALDRNATLNVIKGQEKPKLQGWIPEVGGGNGYHCVPTATPTYTISGSGIIKQAYLFIPYHANQLMPVKQIKQISRNKYKVVLSSGEVYTVIVD